MASTPAPWPGRCCPPEAPVPSGGGAQHLDLDDLDEAVFVAVDEPQAAASGVQEAPAQVMAVTPFDVDVVSDKSLDAVLDGHHTLLSSTRYPSVDTCVPDLDTS